MLVLSWCNRLRSLRACYSLKFRRNVPRLLDCRRCCICEHTRPLDTMVKKCAVWRTRCFLRRVQFLLFKFPHSRRESVRATREAFGNFWKPVKYHVRDVLSVVSAAMRLHNFCIYYYRTQYITFLSSIEERSMQQEAFANWWRNATSLRDEANEQRRTRRDLHNHDLCEQITRQFQQKGITTSPLT